MKNVNIRLAVKVRDHEQKMMRMLNVTPEEVHQRLDEINDIIVTLREICSDG